MTIMLITMVIFLAVTAVVLSGYYAVTAESPAAQRLRRLVPEVIQTQRVQRAEPRRGSRLLQRLLAIIGQYSVGGDESSLTQTLSVAGIRSKSAGALFIAVRTMLSVGPGLAVLFSQVSAGRPLPRALLFAFAVWAYGHILVNYWLKRRARRRIRQMEGALPDSLDLMVVCLEAGLGLNATIARVGEERASMKDPLGQEFSQVSLELREGRSREESLRALGDRNGVEDLKSLASLVIQSDRLGASMAKTLRAHADVLRTKRRQRAEEAARKLPIKILIPLALFVLPPLFVIATGPALLRIKDMVKIITHG
jgi:tight adherence protein C